MANKLAPPYPEESTTRAACAKERMAENGWRPKGGKVAGRW